MKIQEDIKFSTFFFACLYWSFCHFYLATLIIHRVLHPFVLYLTTHANLIRFFLLLKNETSLLFIVDFHRHSYKYLLIDAIQLQLLSKDNPVRFTTKSISFRLIKYGQR